jgi:uncharacterized membrane protein
MARPAVIVVLVLVSALFHALWNALLRLEDDKDRSVVGAVLVASAFALVIAGVRWALGTAPFASGAAVGFTVLAGLLESVYFVTLARALTIGPLGPVYTVSRGGAVLAVWPLSIVLYGELATWTSSSGSALVLLGLILAGLGAHGVGGKADRSGIAWAAVCAVSIAGYHLAYKAALREGGAPSATFAVSLALAGLISVVRLGGGGRATLASLFRTRTWRIVRMGFICGGSFLILMEALARGGSGYVLTLRNTSVLFAIVLAYAIGERPARAEIAGAALVAAGAVLMAWET